MSADRGGFGWFLIGLGVGAAVGVLYAPKSGQETREELASSAREKSEYVREQSRKAAEKVSDITDRGRDQLNEYVDRGKDAVDRGRAQWNQYVDRGRQVVSDHVSKVSDAVEEGKRIQVIACETRPFLQGARLTAWELKKDHVPVTVITDNMAGHVMQRGRVSCVIVGTDRTAANGDVANKIGTYGLAVLAHRHSIPFYVAAPLSSIDLQCPSGERIPIEERPAREVTHVFDRQIAPTGVRVANPAFDVTPSELVTAIVTERGIARQPLARTLPRLFADAESARPARAERKAEPRKQRRRS